MELHLTSLLRDSLALVAGGFIGWAFGLLQAVALRRHEQRQRSGQLKNNWSLIPGSGARIFYLVVALLIVQFVCPLLFVEGTQWLVSGGVLAGYGWMLYVQLRYRLKANAQ